MNGRIAAAGVGVVVVAVGIWLGVSSQKDDVSSVGKRAAPPPSAPAKAALGTARFQVSEKGVATFLIDAPLEKIKGRWTKFRGNLDLDLSDLKKSRGEVDLDLDDLHTETFGDPGKDATQTKHAHNWLELGDDVPNREANRWARFTFSSIESASPSRLADAEEKDGARTVKVIAKGDMWLHGVTSPKTIPLTVRIKGPSNAPTQIEVTTDEPFRISLKEHDVKPRDAIGKFLNGSLEKVGKKIDDSVQVQLSLTAESAAPSAEGAKTKTQ